MVPKTFFSFKTNLNFEQIFGSKNSFTFRASVKTRPKIFFFLLMNSFKKRKKKICSKNVGIVSWPFFELEDEDESGEKWAWNNLRELEGQVLIGIPSSVDGSEWLRSSW